MKRLFFILVTAMMAVFISCERNSGVDTPKTPATPATNDNPSIVEEPSPIKGVWKCQLNKGEMALEYGDHNVKYKCYYEFYKATAIYEGTYTIKGNNITHEFTSLTTKNSSKIEYYSPDQLPKEAVLKDNNTILYMDYLYIRK